ncbi:MAG: hypothetical protein ACM3PY_17660 [Omnitrophica WOR_2 bacterium]
MDDTTDPLEKLWDDLLSRQDDQVRSAYQSLTSDEQGAVLEHLQRMAAEPGWHPEQRLSAQAALRALGET